MKRKKMIKKKKVKKKIMFKEILSRLFIGVFSIGAIALVLLLFTNIYMISKVKDKIMTVEEVTALEDVDCILVLGAGVFGDRPSHMLEDRLLQGIELYNLGASERLLFSGDHGRKDYDEVNVMKEFAIDRDIESEHIFMDHAGFSTYESLYRARDIFEADKLIIVTQEYHLYRALYIADKLGIDAYGIPANPREYAGQGYRDMREMVARTKDFIYGIFKPYPTYLGEAIPVSGNGDLTND